MLHLYYSNHLEIQKEILINLMSRDLPPDPFHSEQILVQSQGMAQWLKLQIAQKCGVAANISFPLPASFIWHQYHCNLPNVPQQNAFQKNAMHWHLMSLIPELLAQPEFAALKKYLGEPIAQQKLYQLASKLADLFDQYLVYRPEWIQAWEQQREDEILQQLSHSQQHNNRELSALLQQDLQSAVSWQGKLWRALYARIQQQGLQRGESCLHRAALHNDYLQQLATNQPMQLPSRLFIFGISALPNVYLQTFQAIAQHCEVHLFFNNPCRYYWGDIVDRTFLQALKLRQRSKHQIETQTADATSLWLNDGQLNAADQDDWQNPLGYLQTGNPLLAAWGKMGRDFLHLLSQSEANEIDAYAAGEQSGLLGQLQNAILDLQPLRQPPPFVLSDDDQSLRIHACHSPMREVEVLHDQLLHWFAQDRSLTPKDIVVMVADVDKYVPYIHAVFSQYNYQDPRFIAYEIADRKHTHSDVIISTFLQLLQLKESAFSAESVLGLLDVAELRARFELDLAELETLKSWVAQNGIRYGLFSDAESTNGEPNYNAWQSGLERMLLGSAMRQADGIWQNTVAFDGSYGLNAQLVGKLGEFLQLLQQWHALLQQPRSAAEWQQQLHGLLQHFFLETEQSRHALLFLSQRIEEVFRTALETEFSAELDGEVVAELLTSHLSQEDNSIHFLNGKLSFCTLLPMRAIPFKVVALLGMNEGDYPRQQNPNSFDLMQYDPQKGDRVRRDDDRYLFLEAILSAQQTLYISYVGRSLTDNQAQQPSVLVSQLLDYLLEQTEYRPDGTLADDDTLRAKLLQQHPMTVFSHANFDPQNPNRSFAHEWLVAEHEQNLNEFVQPLAAASAVSPQIDLSRLLSFVREPLHYFFEKQLGVYFRQQNDEWEDSEVFELSGLERYQLSDKMLQQPTADWQHQFEQFKLQGELPRAHFASLAQQAISTRLQPLSAVIEPYLTETAHSLNINLPLDIDGQEYWLQGTLENLYHGQQIRWRSGNLTISHQIESWLNYLLQIVQQQAPQPAPRYYGIRDGKVVCCTFAEVSLEQAQQQLNAYVADFLRAEQQLLLLPTALYPHFLSDKPKTDKQLWDAIQELAKDGYHDSDRADPYWQRLLSQQPSVDLEAIKLKMQQWFGLMNEKLTS
ncbi:exodeoxyribonuclease V subunit gamma [Testudinibacter sp. P27/CKL/0425]